MKKTIALAKSLMLKKSQMDFDATMGAPVPISKVKVVRDDVAKTYKLMIDGPMGEIVKLFGTIPELKKSQQKMVELVVSVDKMSLIDMTKSIKDTYNYIDDLRVSLKDKIRDASISRKLDEILKRTQDRLYKVGKSILSLPQLKEMPFYTWNYGPGRNQTKSIQKLPKTYEQEQRRRLMDPTAEEIFEEAYKKHHAAQQPPTFDQFEALEDQKESSL